MPSSNLEVTPLMSEPSYAPLPTGDHGTRDTNTRARSSTNTDDPKWTVDDIVYSAHSFAAVARPVGITMVMASAFTVALSSGSETADTSLDVYEVYEVSGTSGDSNSTLLGKSLINSLVIVSVLAGATCVIVLLYRYRYMKCLLGYMMFSSMMLLGMMGGLVFYTALELWQIPMDYLTFYGGLYNFAVVGVVSIFYQTGIPMTVTQTYLVLTSVIMSWQLSRFDEWTGWALLVVLAAYDVCAVLSPCGPLKALVNLMQEYETPMPGLLYEAELPRGARSEQDKTHESLHIHVETSGTALEIEQSSPISSHRNGSESGRERESGSGGQQQQGESGAGRSSQEGGDKHQHEDEEDDDKTIKLGLGDFVFYSVLVAKAALYSFTTCATCLVTILFGLEATLLLLSVYKSALPALPISIFLGVAAYFLGRFSLQPYIEALVNSAVYI